MLQGEKVPTVLWVVSFARQGPMLPISQLCAEKSKLAPSQVPFPQPQESSSQCSPRLPKGALQSLKASRMFSPSSSLGFGFAV